MIINLNVAVKVTHTLTAPDGVKPRHDRANQRLCMSLSQMCVKFKTTLKLSACYRLYGGTVCTNEHGNMLVGARRFQTLNDYARVVQLRLFKPDLAVCDITRSWPAMGQLL